LFEKNWFCQGLGQKIEGENSKKTAH